MRTTDTQVTQLLTLLQARLAAIAETQGARAAVQEYARTHAAVGELAEALIPYFDAAGITIEEYSQMLAKEMLALGINADEAGQSLDSLTLTMQRVQDEEAGHVG